MFSSAPVLEGSEHRGHNFRPPIRSAIASSIDSLMWRTLRSSQDARMSARIVNPVSLDIIREEHIHLAAVIRGLQFLARSIQSSESTPDFKLFRAILYYINEFPGRVHHPKEEQYLFAKIKERTHQLDGELDTLIEQHSEGEELAHQLQTALLRCEFAGTIAIPHFVELVEKYCQFYFIHMRMEEERILPVARQVLNDADWKIVDTAFLKNRDALDQDGNRYRYEQIFAYVGNLAPQQAIGP